VRQVESQEDINFLINTEGRDVLSEEILAGNNHWQKARPFRGNKRTDFQASLLMAVEAHVQTQRACILQKVGFRRYDL